MRKYIKNTTDEFDDAVEIFANTEGMYDISQDSDDTCYTFDTFEDYMNFVNHAKL